MVTDLESSSQDGGWNGTKSVRMIGRDIKSNYIKCKKNKKKQGKRDGVCPLR